jgi:predicted DNA-binding transcriptional regulator YafY
MTSKASDVRVRIVRLVERLFSGQELSSRWIVETFKVSYATAKRDLILLEQCLPVRVYLKENDWSRVVEGTETKILRLPQQQRKPAP